MLLDNKQEIDLVKELLILEIKILNRTFQVRPTHPNSIGFS